jgi:GNAT superfamily N-acetyltransferase
VKGLQIIEVDGERLRTGPWSGGEGRAYVAPLVGGPVPGASAIRRCLDGLTDAGFEAVLTSALHPDEQAPFLECGFRVHERLHLLRHHLGDLPSTPRDRRLRRGRRRDRAASLVVDNAAFPPFWQLDARGLREALTATPVARYRVAVEGGIVGYAVTGRSLDQGYLQRLAVDPERQGDGLGTSLVLDALTWARRRGARSVLVNTQESNERAVALYEHLGFRHEDAGLAVLERSLTTPPLTSPPIEAPR